MINPTFDTLNLKGKVILVRLDLNVPMKNGTITDVERLERSLKTIQKLIQMQAKVVVISHLGRPDGKILPELSLKPVADTLRKLLSPIPVFFCLEAIGDRAKTAVQNLKDDQVLVLENLRFYPGEEANDPAFAKALASLGDVYINDAFSCAHRAHASTVGITQFLPSYPGYLMMEELDYLTQTLSHPQKPYMAIIGGAKVSTKLGLLENLVERLDILALVGAMANTFLLALDREVGKSLVEPVMVNEAKKILEKAEEIGCQVILPVDARVATAPKQGVSSHIVSIQKVPSDQMILDTGPETVQHILKAIEKAKTLVWNGALGVTEIKPFDESTTQVAYYVAERTRAGDLLSVAGGGDTVLALKQASVYDDFTYISTAGGAFLEWLEGKLLPGVEALEW